jgi:hypothetical protein
MPTIVICLDAIIKIQSRDSVIGVLVVRQATGRLLSTPAVAQNDHLESQNLTTPRSDATGALSSLRLAVGY